ncbi:MAG: metal-dependent transcriptional regulator, partial [bacterium]
SRSGRKVRVTALARRMGVSKPSVVAGLAELERRGLVAHERYGGGELTGDGLAAAKRVYRRHVVLEEFLRELLGVGPATAAADACAVEHVLSPETVERLELLVGAFRGRARARLRRRLAVAGGEKDGERRRSAGRKPPGPRTRKDDNAR